ncbi:NRDE family protein [Oceanobacillus rekensis]|uniref:NRDE family protein n=1 Tax=Oceanobacillus rekensis TaxID=937927 RepID=UPI000B435002|nr:NRDE family protein [Oceanobacillus rekensis]
MCLINFQLHDHANYKLVIAANRDEFYERPTAQAQFWEDKPTIMAGRDLMFLGTWLGITKSGRFAALTNYRDPTMEGQMKNSRGEIVTNYLTSNQTPEVFLKTLSADRNNYAGFNVIVGDSDQLFYYNNIQDDISLISSGTHALSNHFLDTPWPKVVKGRRWLEEYLQQNRDVNTDKLFEIVSNAEMANDKYLPDTGVGVELERKLSPLFIRTPDYGTRSSTVLLVDKNNQVTFVERTYNKGIFQKENHYDFELTKD